MFAFTFAIAGCLPLIFDGSIEAARAFSVSATGTALVHIFISALILMSASLLTTWQSTHPLG